MKQVLLLLSLSVFITSCARKRTMERVQRYNIKTIAVLPVQLELVGNMPKNVTAEQLQKSLEQQSKFMYRALYIDLVQYTDTRLRRYSQVQFQSLDRTRTLLSEKKISDSASWQMDPAELSKMLGVDAVVSMKVTQNRIMSDQAALSVDVVGGIIRSTVPGLSLPTGAARTSDMYVNCALMKEGYSVWSTRFTNSTDWNYPVQEAIQSVTRGIARRFPL